MSKTVVYIATSLDGYIATADGAVAWLKPFEEYDYGYEGFIHSVDRLVMGRNTYEQCLTFGQWPYPNKTVHVMTRRPIKNPPVGVTPYSGGVDGLIIQIGVQAAKKVWIVGGADTISQFMDRDLVDEIQLFVMPVLLGRGIPLFPASDKPVSLVNESAKRYDNGVVGLVYRRA